MAIFLQKTSRLRARSVGMSILLGVVFGVASAPAALAMTQVSVQKDQSLRIALNGAAGNIIVTNPRIADVTVVDSRTLYIIGRGVGASGVTVTDQSGRAIWEASVLVSQAPANAVMLFRGTQPVINVCLSTCVEVTARADASAGSGADTSPIASGTAAQ